MLVILSGKVSFSKVSMIKNIGLHYKTYGDFRDNWDIHVNIELHS